MEIFFYSNSPQAPSNLISLTILVFPKPFTLFEDKISAIKLQKGTKTFLVTAFPIFSLRSKLGIKRISSLF